MSYYYKHKGIKYQIVINDDDDIEWRDKQIYNDFKYLEHINDWNTINNRVYNGIKYKWLIKHEK